MANLKKLKKELVKLNQEELKEVLEFTLSEDEDEVEVKEEVVETPEVKEEPKKEEVEQPQYATLDDIKGLLEKAGYVKKEELEAVTKKAKPFGVDPAKEKPIEKTNQRTNQDYLNMVNQKRY